MTPSRWPPGQVLHGAEITHRLFDTLIAALSATEVLALTALREADARLEQERWVPNPIQAAIDVLEVIDTRIHDHRWAGLGPKGVCLARRQFSCWASAGGAQNHFRLLTDAQRLLLGLPVVPKLDDLQQVASTTLHGDLLHTLDGATHYHADWLAPFPAWTHGATRIDNRWGHIFYKDVR